VKAVCGISVVATHAAVDRRTNLLLHHARHHPLVGFLESDELLVELLTDIVNLVGYLLFVPVAVLQYFFEDFSNKSVHLVSGEGLFFVGNFVCHILN